MEKQLVTQPTRQQEEYEYLLVANPNVAVQKQVMDATQDFYRSYLPTEKITTKPQITVASFMASEAMEETIIKWLQRICGKHYSFSVMLNNYGGFPLHTIYLRVQNPQPFISLSRQLKVIDSYLQNNGHSPAKLAKQPQITIANCLQNTVYQQAILEYAHKEFNASFWVEELVLLKKYANKEDYKQLGIFRFLPQQQAVANWQLAMASSEWAVSS